MSRPHSPPSSGELSQGDDSATKRGSSVLTSILVIAIGAALGALLRWYLAARFNQTFPQLPPGTLAVGELGLGGEIRSVPQLDTRLREASRLGVAHAVVPHVGGNFPKLNGMALHEIRRLSQALADL